MFLVFLAELIERLLVSSGRLFERDREGERKREMERQTDTERQRETELERGHVLKPEAEPPKRNNRNCRNETIEFETTETNRAGNSRL